MSTHPANSETVDNESTTGGQTAIGLEPTVAGALAYVLGVVTGALVYVNYPILLPRRSASVLEGGALMWTPGYQSPAMGW